MGVGTNFSMFAEFEKVQTEYGRSTFQTFTTLRSKKFPEGDAAQKMMVYSELTLQCVHYDEPKWKGTGKRSVQWPRKFNCPIQIRITNALQLLIRKGDSVTFVCSLAFDMSLKNSTSSCTSHKITGRQGERYYLCLQLHARGLTLLIFIRLPL